MSDLIGCASSKKDDNIENNGYKVNWGFQLISSYKDTPKEEDWSKCPFCGLMPKVWIFDNGKSTGCGCGNSTYDHFSVHAESILSVYNRCNGNLSEYNSDQLRLNWNEYCSTMKNPCSREDLASEGRY